MLLTEQLEMVAPTDMDTEAPIGLEVIDSEADSEDSVTRIKFKNQLAHLAKQGGF